ncbi:DUF4221 domain-containing protein [Belliella sp. DSM 111904]|uniref:DUF4221 domain-containing protein n=1 Tax=Belliella filtrata TaxID=2923435 RepID=A0ABS9V3J4_9BACT|nr:DUF4221 family protein [Belliella filtrata]MCH7410784.1 DUF4221 domain-containing protein [Belliella filtrata]
MKYFTLLIIALAMFSCGGDSEQRLAKDYADFTLSMDTVVVDAGEEILMAGTSSNLKINKAGSKLYFWDVKAFQLELIDVENLILEEKRLFEREGPNGVGSYPYDIHLINDEKIAFNNFTQSIILAKMNGEVIKHLSLNNELLKEGLDEGESLNPLAFSEDGKLMYCGINNFFSKSNSNIVVVDLEQEQTQVITLEAFQKRENFRVTFSKSNGEYMEVYADVPKLEVISHKDQLIFWCDAFNAIYRYDPQSAELRLYEITNSLFPNEKSGTYSNDPDTIEEMQEMTKKLKEEILFSKLFWDASNNVFYRFASFNLPTVGDEKVKSKVFISIIDENFEVIGEQEISDIFNKVPSALFVKNGLIYCYLNVDDELGLIRMKIN